MFSVPAKEKLFAVIRRNWIRGSPQFCTANGGRISESEGNWIFSIALAEASQAIFLRETFLRPFERLQIQYYRGEWVMTGIDYPKEPEFPPAVESLDSDQLPGISGFVSKS
jgi:hypothetical protein